MGVGETEEGHKVAGASQPSAVRDSQLHGAQGKIESFEHAVDDNWC